jgi:transposase
VTRIPRNEGFPIVRPHAAAVDTGRDWHSVCATLRDGSTRELTTFGTTTPELIGMAEWLTDRGVVSVALECRRDYWIAPYEILEGHGFDVLVVETRKLMHLPARDKNMDGTNCEWIHRLHSCGLLRGCFPPPGTKRR